MIRIDAEPCIADHEPVHLICSRAFFQKALYERVCHIQFSVSPCDQGKFRRLDLYAPEREPSFEQFPISHGEMHVVYSEEISLDKALRVPNDDVPEGNPRSRAQRN